MVIRGSKTFRWLVNFGNSLVGQFLSVLFCSQHRTPKGLGLVMSGNAVEVDMVDLTCRSLPYDTHLVKGLRGIGMEVDLWTAGCLSEQQEAVERSAVLDFAGNTLALRGPFRKVAKGVEYLINGVRATPEPLR